jgi:hypothetical protein
MRRFARRVLEPRVGGKGNRARPGSDHGSGRTVSARVPPSSIRYTKRFRWNAGVGTLGRATQITDEVPDVGTSSLHPRLARFPSAARRPVSLSAPSAR